MGTLIGELRYAVRQFWVARVFTATAVLTLALGIGGTTATIARATGSFVRSAASRRQSRRLVWNRGACARRGRLIRHHGLQGCAAHERDRPADGARRRSAKSYRDGDAGSVLVCRDRSGAGSSARRWRGSPSLDATLRRVILGSAGAGLRHAVAADVRLHRG